MMNGCANIKIDGVRQWDNNNGIFHIILVDRLIVFSVAVIGKGRHKMLNNNLFASLSLYSVLKLMLKETNSLQPLTFSYHTHLRISPLLTIVLHSSLSLHSLTLFAVDISNWTLIILKPKGNKTSHVVIRPSYKKPSFQMEVGQPLTNVWPSSLRYIQTDQVKKGGHFAQSAIS